jgi:hypothetical protein
MKKQIFNRLFIAWIAQILCGKRMIQYYNSNTVATSTVLVRNFLNYTQLVMKEIAWKEKNSTLLTDQDDGG